MREQKSRLPGTGQSAYRDKYFIIVRILSDESLDGMINQPVCGYACALV